MNPVYRRTNYDLNRRLPGPLSIKTKLGTQNFHYRFYRRASVYPLFGTYSLPRGWVFSILDRVSTIIFAFMPLLIIPVYLQLARLLYPRLQLFPRIFRGRMFLRPPSGVQFFQEMSVLLLAILFVLLLQAIFAFILLRKAPWSEAILVGGLLSLAIYGVMRGFQAPGDALFYPLPALGGALIIGIGLSVTTLYPYLRKVFRFDNRYSEAQIRG